MKHYYIVSLVKNGLLGGGLTADEQAITYHTGKVTVPKEYRHLQMKYSEICKASMGWLVVLPTITVQMKSGETYTFAVFFAGKRLLNTLRTKGVDTES